MQKNIVLFSLIVTIIIVLNCNLVYSEPIEDNIDENIKKENIGPYPTLDDLKKELQNNKNKIIKTYEKDYIFNRVFVGRIRYVGYQSL